MSIWIPLPPALWRNAAELAHYGFLAIEWLGQNQSQTANPQALALGVVVSLLPGTLLSVALWLGINRLFRRASVGGALLALNAREPNPSALKELQFRRSSGNGHRGGLASAKSHADERF